jgi:PIN domain nuclease of toxin-antitoxin system
MIVLDTHALLWWASAPDKLGAKARRLCERADRIGLSPISFWEVGVLCSRGRLRLTTTLSEWARDVLDGPRIEQLPLTTEIAVLAAGLASLHGDPADRMIVATAIRHGCKLVSRDQAIERSGLVETVWG